MKNIILLLFISTSFVSFSQETKTTYLGCNFEKSRKKKALYRQESTEYSNKIVNIIVLKSTNILIKEIEIDKENNSSVETKFWKNGNKYSITNYKNYSKHGKESLFQWTGELKQTTQYVNGKKSGKELIYNFNEEVTKEYSYKKGEKNGQAIFFIDDSTTRYYNYKNGEKDGLYLEKKLPNLTNDSGFYKNGKLNGLFTSFYESGKLNHSVNYLDGKRNGWYKRFYETGELMDIANYDNGSIIKVDKGYFRDGSLKDSTNYFNGEKNGLSVGFYSNGNPKWKTIYKNDKISGEDIDYWENGKVKFKSVYENGENISKICFDENGDKFDCDFNEKMAVFKGGEVKLFEYLSRNVKYPEEARECGFQGKVYVKFVVEKDGSLTNIEIARGFNRACDEVAMEAVKNMPNWEPGEQRDKKVRSRFVLPVNFVLR